MTVKSASEDASSHKEAIFSYCLRDEFHVETEDVSTFTSLDYFFSLLPFSPFLSMKQ